MEEEKEIQELRVAESLQVNLQRYGMAAPSRSYLV